MGNAPSRSRAAARATKLRWLWIGADHFVIDSIELWPAIGEVKFVMKGDGWDATFGGKHLGTFPSCRAAKLAVRKEVRKNG